jgi:RNA polymerase sigma-70 factor (ECF subfamily)
MTIINLNRYYYPQYSRNTLVEVPDEVAEILERGQRAEHNQESKKTYHKVYSLDQSPALENHATHFALSPEEVLLRDMDAAADALLLARLNEAMSRLSPTQARRLHARYVLNKKFREIAADEGISGSCAATSVTSAVKKLQKFFIKNGWMPKEA